MLARQMITTSLIFLFASCGWSAFGNCQEGAKGVDSGEKLAEKKQQPRGDQNLEKRILDEVKNSLKKFENKIGKKKLGRILENIQRELAGRDEHWSLRLDPFDPEMLKEHHLKMAEKIKKLAPKSLGPHAFQLQLGNKRRLVGILLTTNDESKVVVQKVMPGSAAASSGMEAGDVITRVNDKEIANPNALSQIIQGSKGVLEFHLTRGGEDLILEIEPKEVNHLHLGNAFFDVEGPDLEGLDLPNIFSGDRAKAIELNSEFGSKEGGKEAGEHRRGGKKIVLVDPENFRKKIELKIERADENRKHLKNRAAELHKKIEFRAGENADFQQAIDQLERELKRMRQEIEELRQSKKIEDQ